MKSNSRAYNRFMSYRKAARRRRLAEECCGYSYYSNLHQYSKNKIHCSCPMCSTKTRNKGRRNSGNYNKAINYSTPDLKRQIAMDQDELEVFGKRTPRRTHTW